MSDPGAFASETTAAGCQALVAGVAPITAADRLALRAAVALGAFKPQKPMDFGLFDLAARDQLDLFANRPGASAVPLPEAPTPTRR